MADSCKHQANQQQPQVKIVRKQRLDSIDDLLHSLDRSRHRRQSCIILCTHPALLFTNILWQSKTKQPAKRNGANTDAVGQNGTLLHGGKERRADNGRVDHCEYAEVEEHSASNVELMAAILKKMSHVYFTYLFASDEMLLATV